VLIDRVKRVGIALAKRVQKTRTGFRPVDEILHQGTESIIFMPWKGDETLHERCPATTLRFGLSIYGLLARRTGR
jgi:hypothetical protein